MRNRYIRRHFIFLIAITMTFLMIGCGNTKNAIESTAESTVNEYEWLYEGLREYTTPLSNIDISNSGDSVSISITIKPYTFTSKSILEMGNTIYYTKQYCDDNLDSYSLYVLLYDREHSSTPFLWRCSPGPDWGTIIDYRSGEAEVTILKDIDALCSFFPALTTEINLSLLDQYDKEVYLEVMDALDSRTNDSEEIILSDIAPNYGLTPQQLNTFMKDVMQKVHSTSHVFDAKTPIVYPKSTESPLFEYFNNPPKIIYSTPASENGLEGNIYSVVGEVQEHGTVTVESNGADLPYFIIQTDLGPVLFHDSYTYNLVVNEAKKDVFIEQLSDYTFPSISDCVKVYGVYQGFSMVFNMPSFIYGIPKWIEK